MVNQEDSEEGDLAVANCDYTCLPGLSGLVWSGLASYSSSFWQGVGKPAGDARTRTMLKCKAVWLS